MADLRKAHQIGNEFRKRHSLKTCMAKNITRICCNGNAIYSHTISKSSSLSKIAKNGMVYVYDGRNYMEIHKNKGMSLPRLCGVGKASTFQGFCSEHDSELFAPIERKNFESTPEECFLHFYRAFTKEYYNKLVEFLDKDRVLNSIESEYVVEKREFCRRIYKSYYSGIQVALKGMEQQKAKMEQYLEKQDFSDLRALILEFEQPLPFMVSGATRPEQDFKGNFLQSIRDEKFNSFDTLGLISFSDENKWYFVLAWLSVGSDVNEKFIDSFLSIKNNHKFGRLVKMTFHLIDNIIMSPDWWDKLSIEKKDYFNNLMNSGLNPNIPKSKHPLKDDGYKLKSIPIGKITKVNF
ncbi:hypothetical protein IC798_12240 [Acinetobacter seifertii]|uniref:hypothetical protein n=1 Tax=Acinetobacter seifertii TaxID=1530123 RepID=UPI00168D305C|nr:hypothetical protein [Acinetobacter seifertii]QNX00810.1 hypothetical protein IC798_12240 [Acinetobacter seifertii]